MLESGVDGSSRRHMQAQLLPLSNERETARGYLETHMERVAAGDTAALTTVYKLTSPKIYALLLRMLPQSVADEVLQDVYATVWGKAHTYNASIASPITWLVTIARNKAIDRLRSEKDLREARNIEDVKLSLADPSPSSLTRIEYADETRRLHECLDALQHQQRDAIFETFFGGFTYQQLSEKRGVPLGTMKSWIRRGLASLKDCLEQ